MYRYARTRCASDQATTAYYLSSAEFLVDHLLRFLQQQKADRESLSLLDFASGYGRFTRYFVRLFRRVTVSDLEPEMLAFCREQFGAVAFLSSLDPADVAGRPERYDVVFSFSLFTHLPKPLWLVWFRVLWGMVAEGGYLVISTHSYELLARTLPWRLGRRSQQLLAFAGRRLLGFTYLRSNETDGRLGPASYGTTIAGNRFIKRVLAGTGGIERAWRYGMGEFDQFHDIHILQKRAASTPAQ